MCNDTSVQLVRFFRFMRLFRITLFSIVRIETDYIYAVVAWEEDCLNGIPDNDNVQPVKWYYDADPIVDDALTVGECAYEYGWISIDKLSINASRISEDLGWDKKKIKLAVDKLKTIKVSMIDDGIEGDSFFLHE